MSEACLDCVHKDRGIGPWCGNCSVRFATLQAERDELRQIVARLASSLIAGGVPREDVEIITGAYTPPPNQETE